MMTLDKNMIWALDALRYTKAQLKTTANKPGDFIRIWPLICVRYERGKSTSSSSAREWTWIHTLASRARHFQCGNCAEHAAVAFVFLQTRGIIPIDYMEGQNVDHAFVVIGREQNGKKSHWTTWGPNAVVCDPWAGKCFPAKEIPVKMIGGSGIQTASAARLG